MKRSLALRVVTLLFSLAGLTLAILHGCSKPTPAPQAAAAPTTEASEPSVEEDPAYLGATKAAVMVHPKPQSSAKKK